VHPFFSLGRLEIPVYGLVAAAGLICAMALGLRTARMARVDRDALWDVGMVTVFSAFVLTRALLVVENLHTFLMYPVLVLELPSLTPAGGELTAVVALAYMRRRRMPLLSTLDALAPCGALLGAFLSLGLVADGTREGMPTALLWAVPSSFGRVHPVEAYLAMGWLVLCGVLLRILRGTTAPGVTAAWGLVLGGLLLFVMDFFHLPQLLYGTKRLDSIQWHALELMGAGSLLLAWCFGVGVGAKASAPQDIHDAV